MVRFVEVEKDVVSVELSVDTLSRIAGAFSVLENEGLGDSRDQALGAGFSNAYERLTATEAEPLAEWERLLLEGPDSE
jgi:hypothetical protein